MNDDQTLQRVYDLCLNSNQGRGVWKNLDEARQLLEHIKKYAPEIMYREGCVEGWIARWDCFITDLVHLLEIEAPEWQSSRGYPRPWPGDYKERHYECTFPPVTKVNSSASAGEASIRRI